LENVKLAVRGDINIVSEVLNSSIYSMGKVIVGNRGFLMGVDIYAAHGLACGKIGKTSGKAARIHVGIDFTVQKQIEKTTADIRVITGKQEQLKSLLAAAVPDSERYKKLLETALRFDIEMKKAAAIIETLQMRVVIDEKATVDILTEAAQGTLIEICQVALFVEQPIRRTRLKFDKAQGRIIQTGF
jgi:uncharacterized protein (DUF342 family)